MHSACTAKQVRQALSIYARPQTRRGVALYLIDLGQYLAALAAVLWLPWLAGKLLAAVLMGIKMANLVTLAHDAAHNSLTRSRPLNKFIAITSLTPALFNYRLWVYDHHQLHHPNTNEQHPDSYTPYPKATFDALPGWQQTLERLYRAPTLWTFGLYYIVERWSRAKFIPRRHMPDAVRREAWPHFFYLMGYGLAYVVVLAAAPLYSNTGTLTALVLGFAVPFYVFQSLFAFTVYVQHTHPRVAWFAGVPDRNGDARQDYISVQLRFPHWLSVMMHHVFDHAAHHVHPAIPCYHLPAAQAKLNEMIGARAISEKFSFAWLKQVQRRCKLYDYEQHRWLDFSGRASSRVTLDSASESGRPVWTTRAATA